MELTLELAQKLRDALNEKLQEMQSYAVTSPLTSPDAYEVKIVLHPDDSSLEEKLQGVTTVPWKGPPTGEPYVERTPRTPSQRKSPFDDWYPGITKRRREPSTYYPDVNPNYPGLRRVPEIQDLVRRVAMSPDLSARLSKVGRVLDLSKRLSVLAAGHVGHGYQKESEFLVEELLGLLKADGFTGRHKCVRVVNAIKKAMQADGYTFEIG